MHLYGSFEEVLERIMYLDNNDEAYLAMLEQKVFLNDNHLEIYNKRLEDFLLHIFNQPLEKAYRRGFGQWRCNLEKRYKKLQKLRRFGNNIADIIQKPLRFLKKRLK
ncbi:hypothetical protein [Helicobacter jaachi]|uniref:hypothetical protein n=1 Tax=Helicobacter jaachi TaxID=1677920 RepID=UPI000A55FAD3|nr:hypothetical protein [Helicobacter jaachi]